MIENVMEHLAHDLGVDPLELRLANMVDVDPAVGEKNILPSIVDALKGSSEYEQRKQEIETFNASNKWKKKGLALVPMMASQWSGGAMFYFQLSIYAGDGSIAISCGAIEMGQVCL